MKLANIAAALAAACFGAHAREGVAMVNLYGSDLAGASDDPLKFQAAQDLLGSAGGLLPDDAGAAVQQLLLTGEVKPAAIKGLASQIGGLVKKLTGEVTTSHNGNKKEISSALKIIDMCRGPRFRKSSGVWTRGITTLSRKARSALKRVHRCNAQKRPLEQRVKSCSAQVKALREARNALCVDFVNSNKLVATEASSCGGNTEETQHQWVKRMTTFVRSEMRSLKKHKRKCGKGERRLRGPARACGLRQRRLKKRERWCNVRLRGKSVEATCALKAGKKSMCGSYKRCYANQVAMYAKLTNRTKQDVVTRKLQWRMLKRLECLVGAYDMKGGKIDKAKLDTCVAAGIYSTDHLNIVVPPAPPAVPCSASASKTLELALAGASCKLPKKVAKKKGPKRAPRRYWSKCVRVGRFVKTSLYNLCEPGYTQKGQIGVDPSWKKNVRGCCTRRNRRGHCMLGARGRRVRCENAASPAGYLSGRCTRLHPKRSRQCKGGSIRSAGRKGGCRYKSRRGWRPGYQAVCKAR